MLRHKSVLLFVGLILSACVLRPEWQRLAEAGNLERDWIETASFRHLVLRNNMAGDHLRIYVEGDGTPWVRSNRVSIDPTPTNPVMLRLMHGSIRPSVYLGRPCYFGSASAPECHARYWTFDRYGEQVVQSMCQAANEIATAARSVELIGYSGGGAIVVAMTACTNKLVSVMTIAGNLDPAAWVAHHGYSPLADSNDFRALPPEGVREIHWQCRHDDNVPPSVTEQYFHTRPGATRHVIDDCSHSEGFEQALAADVE